MSRSVMVIGGGLLQIPAISRAKSMGLKTLVTDYNSHAPGLQMADVPVVMSTRDIDGSVRKARELQETHNIQGVLTVGTDASTTVAAVAAALGLPGIRYNDAVAATNKIKMRQRLKDHGIPVPAFLPIWSLWELKESLKKLNLPVVLKPSSNMGARGVRRIQQKNELEEAFHFAKNASPNGELIVEDFMDGPELSIDVIVYQNQVFFAGIADRIIEYAPYFVETGHNMPSAMAPEQIDQAKEIMRLGIEALNIHNGAAKGDIKMTPKGPMIGELAARLSGGFMSAYTYPYSTGMDSIGAAIRVALGEEPGVVDSDYHQVAIERAILDQEGRIETISGVEEALRVDGVKNIFITKEMGDLSVSPQSNIDKIGHIVAVGQTLAEAEDIAYQARQKINIKIQAQESISFAEIKKNAIQHFNRTCHVCNVCDGVRCASGIPGMGGVGQMHTFQANTKALNDYVLRVDYVRQEDVREPDTSLELLGHRLCLPVWSAPVTGTVTNMGGMVQERAYLEELIEGCRRGGSVAFLGDGSKPEKYKIGLDLLSQSQVKGIPIFKPHADEKKIMERVEYATRSGAMAWGMDIDSFHIQTMRKKGVELAPKSTQDLEQLRHKSPLPMIIKGILTADDAERCVDAGMDALVVSNHGGRVIDGLPASIRVLEDIVHRVRGKIHIFIDGGFREPLHVFVALALGAEAVLIGRPVAIYNMGGGAAGVDLYFRQMRQGLADIMRVMGCPSLKDIRRDMVYSS